MPRKRLYVEKVDFRMYEQDLKRIISSVENIGRSPNAENFNIAVGVNEKFVAPLGIMLTSLAINNPKREIDVNIGTSDISADSIDRLKKFVERYSNISINIYHIDGETLADYVGRKNPTAAYYRVVMATVLYPAVKKLLYMDVDTLFLGKIEDFEAIEFGDKTFFAVEDTLRGISLKEHKEELGLGKEDKYFNSGVMYIDLKKWHENNISEKVIEMLHERAMGIRTFSFMDQGAMNSVTVGLWGELSDRLHLMIPVLREKYKGKLLEDTVILHYAGAYKPWKFTSEGELAELSENCVDVALFDKYRKESLWADFYGYQKRYTTLRLISRWMMIKGEWGLFIKWYIKYLLCKYKMD
ncbi:MAG: glycosyltransferase family 8 protein [Selenomonas ruminantium]|nr:glycosyltransferase family 8 protein [Selenomonas ruminantium]